ncbi:MAG TPA: DUF2946 family protein [Hyphomicrobiaceae bacterium]|nr:DUF2946 family protein [Hyphomicrobiaceae bacterium]
MAILALLAKLVIAAFCAAPPKAGLSQDTFGPFVICTVHGPVTPDGSEPKQSPSPETEGHCAACTLVQIAALLLAAALLTAAVSRVPPVRWRPTLARLLPDHLSTGSIRSRAPPLPA